MLFSIIKSLLYKCLGKITPPPPLEKSNLPRTKPSVNMIFLEGINIEVHISLVIMQ